MVEAEGYIYLKAGVVTIMPIPVASASDYWSATPEERSTWIIIALALNQFNDLCFHKYTVH